MSVYKFKEGSLATVKKGAYKGFKVELLCGVGKRSYALQKVRVRVLEINKLNGKLSPYLWVLPGSLKGSDLDLVDCIIN